MLYIPCDCCQPPNVYHVTKVSDNIKYLSLMHRKERTKNEKPYFGQFTRAQPPIDLTGTIDGLDLSTIQPELQTFGQNQREALKRAILLFGLNRIAKIKESSETMSKVSTQVLEK